MGPSDQSGERFSIKHLPYLLKKTAVSWNKDDPWRLSAIVAYYAILSLPGLLVIIINSLSHIFGSDTVEGKIYDEIGAAMGTFAAEGVASIFESARTDEQSLIATLIGIGVLVFGAMVKPDDAWQAYGLNSGAFNLKCMS
jgi:membrane protein